MNAVRVNSTYCNKSIILIGAKTVLDIQDFKPFFTLNVTSNNQVIHDAFITIHYFIVPNIIAHPEQTILLQN